ncbi:hypothetical protein ES708_18184 [subsurface metagenome]
MVTEAEPFVIQVRLRSSERHPHQKRMIESEFKRLIVKAGRRGGKTVGFAIRIVKRFLKGRRQLYAAPTKEQTDTCWYEIKRALPNLEEAVKRGYLKLNEVERYIEIPRTKQRIKVKTAWNANTLRGDYADDLYLDEFQLMAEDTWGEVGAPMLADNNGDAVLIYTPASLMATGVSKARDPRHASKLFKKAEKDTTGLWETIHFTSLDNPFISQEALALIAADMSLESYRREIMAEDDEIELTWLVYSKFNETICKIPRFPIPTNWPVYSGHDFGSANPAALFLAQVRLPLPPGAPAYMRYNDLVAFREYCPGSGFSIPQHRDRFKELTTGYEVKKSVGGNVTSEGEIRQGYLAHGWPIQAPQITKVPAQIDRVIGLMELNKFYVFNDMPFTLAELSNCLWQLDAERKPLNKIDNEQRYHLLSCLRTLGSDFSPETASGEGAKTSHDER